VKVLLVDDSKFVRQATAQMLRKIMPLDIDEAADGSEALRRIHNNNFDLIFLDWNMPVMDGLQFLRHFRKVDPVAYVIMLTTESDKAFVVEAVKAGANDYIVKPLSEEVLSKRLLIMAQRLSDAA
jgi:two-component system, chemotaxis family, chemotaxis protein CheY